MNNTEKLQIYEKVNASESLEELSEVILNLADEGGFIQGRTKKFNAEQMAHCCKNYDTFFRMQQPNVLTREFGIRQQAMYIIYYNKE